MTHILVGVATEDIFNFFESNPKNRARKFVNSFQFRINVSTLYERCVCPKIIYFVCGPCILTAGRSGDLCEVWWPGGPSSSHTFPPWAAARGSRLHRAGKPPDYERRDRHLDVSVCGSGSFASVYVQHFPGAYR